VLLPSLALAKKQRDRARGWTLLRVLAAGIGDTRLLPGYFPAEVVLILEDIAAIEVSAISRPSIDRLSRMRTPRLQRISSSKERKMA
jgi:hypothetical protein